jgi:ribonuclease P protein component
VLPAPNRLRERSDFTSAVRSFGGCRAGSRLLVVHATSTGARAGLPPRVGFVVSKAVGGAVVRNRTKRRLRALVAQRLTAIPAGVDLVVRANPPAAQASSRELADALDPLVHRVVKRLGGTG